MFFTVRIPYIRRKKKDMEETTVPAHTRNKENILHYLGRIYGSRGFAWSLVGIGMILRLSQYLFDRNLNIDEAGNAMNLLTRPVSDLLSTQTLPIGFLLAEKGMIRLFGDGENVLRFIPLLCGFISLILFYRLAVLAIDRKAVPLALCLFVFSDRLIYFSTSVSQYESDAVVAMVLSIAAIQIETGKNTVRRILLYGLTGAIALWLSHSALVILSAVFLSMTCYHLKNRELSRNIQQIGAYCMWTASFAILYVYSLHALSQNRMFYDFWKWAYLPFPPKNLEEFKNFSTLILSIFKEPARFPAIGIAAFAFLTGCISVFSNRRKAFWILLSPILIAIAASAFDAFAFYGRLLIFFLPALLLFTAQGMEWIRSTVSKKSVTVGVLFIAMILAHPVILAGYHFLKPRTHEQIKPVMQIVSNRWQDGDFIYVYYGASAMFGYYLRSFDFKEKDYRIGLSSRNDRSRYLRELESLRGRKRIWFIFSHIWYDEERLFIAFLDRLGTRQFSARSPESSVYLYDLSQRPE